MSKSAKMDADIALDSMKTRRDVELSAPSAHEVTDIAKGINSDITRLDPFGLPLQPAATGDELDPLEWSKARKYFILFIACVGNFLTIYITVNTVQNFFVLTDLFDATYSEINWTMAVTSLGIVTALLLFSPLVDLYGRRKVMAVSSALTCIVSGCITLRSLNYNAYLALRFLQGLATGPMTTASFAIMIDISWEHEMGFHMGLWAISIDLAFTIGAIISGFTASTGPYWAQWHVAIIYGLLFLLCVSFLPETLYPRDVILEKIHNGEAYHHLQRTKDIKIWNLTTIPGIPRIHLYTTVLTFFTSFKRSRLVIVALTFSFFQYWWSPAFLTMGPIAYASFDTETQGLFYIGFTLGVLMTEVLGAGRLSDYICSKLALRNDGVRRPEMRLYLGYPAAVVSTIGLVIWGLAVDRSWHWMVSEVGLFMIAVGLQTGFGAVCAYIFECYHDNYMHVMMFLLVFTNGSSFVVSFFINDWVTAVGFTWSFGTQGLICLLLIPVYVYLQTKGRDLA